MAKKRNNGEGSWTQRNNGTWKLSVSYKGLGRKYFYGDKQTCLKKKHEFEALLNKGIVGDKDTLFKDFIHSWLFTIKQPSLKPSSFDRLERTLKEECVVALYDLEMKQIDGHLIQTLVINKMKNDGYAYATIKKTYFTLGEIFKYALLREKINKNPMLEVVMPSKVLFTEKERRYLSKQEREKLIQTCYAKRKNGVRIYKYGALYVFLLYSGCRIGEALALKWSDINFETRTANINKTIVYIKNRKDDTRRSFEIVQPSTKTGQPRIIYLSDMAIAALKDLQEQLGWDKNGYVVHVNHTKPIYRSAAQHTFDRIIKRAGIKHCGVHALRHSFVSLMLHNNVPLTMVSQMVGHLNINMTMQVYSHLLDETKIESMSIIKDIK